MQIKYYPDSRGLNIASGDEQSQSLLCITGIPEDQLITLRDDLNRHFPVSRHGDVCGSITRKAVFDEPEECGLYVTQSGRFVFNGAGSYGWRFLYDDHWGTRTDWHGVRAALNNGEFPLVKIDGGMYLKGVGRENKD